MTEDKIKMMSKFISSMIVPKFQSIEGFEIQELKVSHYDETLLNTKERFEITFYVDGIEEEDEVEIEDMLLGMKDYLGLTKTTKLHLKFVVV